METIGAFTTSPVPPRILPWVSYSYFHNGDRVYDAEAKWALLVICSRLSNLLICLFIIQKISCLDTGYQSQHPSHSGWFVYIEICGFMYPSWNLNLKIPNIESKLEKKNSLRVLVERWVHIWNRCDYMFVGSKQELMVEFPGKCITVIYDNCLDSDSMERFQLMIGAHAFDPRQSFILRINIHLRGFQKWNTSSNLISLDA